MSYITPLRPGESNDPEVNKRLEEAKKEWWNDSAFFGLLGHNPQLLETTVNLFKAAIAAAPGIPVHVLELMRLKGSEINRCDYCVNMRLAAVKEKVSTKEDAIFGTVDPEKLDRTEFLAVSLAEQMAKDPNAIPPSFFEELKAEFTEQQILGLVYAASVFGLGNKINSTLQLTGFECSFA